jgi:hypothetical protein
MQQTTHSTQVYYPFGSGYVPESHDPEHVRKSEPLHRQRAIMLLVSLLAVSTAAGAIAATRWNRTANRALWAHEVPASIMKFPASFGTEEPVY